MKNKAAPLQLTRSEKEPQEYVIKQQQRPQPSADEVSRRARQLMMERKS